MRRIALACVAFALVSGCADRVAGGSSGVDNPEIAVAFTGPGGAPRSVTGSISLYRANQNPAVNPSPLAEIQLTNATSAVLRAETSGVVTLRPFPKIGAAMGDTVSEYNLFLRSGTDSGSIQLQLVYDDTAHSFKVDGKDDTAHESLALVVGRFNRYTGWLHRDSAGPGPDRVFIPGTPFQAVVVDSTFTFPALPEGVYRLKVYTATGWEYEVRGFLDTRVPGIFTIDSSRPPERPDELIKDTTLAALAGEDHGAFLEAANFLSGDVDGGEDGDPRLALLWRQISGPAKADIEDPTALRTPVAFPVEGAYRFVLSVSFGLSLAADTVLIGVRLANAGEVAFIEPTLGDTVRLGQSFNVIWQGRKVEILTLDLSIDSGVTWRPINSNLPSTANLGIFPWTPSVNLGTAEHCRLRLVASDSATVAQSAGFLLR